MQFSGHVIVKREFDENINMESSNERIRLLANEGISVSTPVELTLLMAKKSKFLLELLKLMSL